ncbi:uncharacterized protein FOMMEDRAFT_99171, partial [Fomitiporia mediterranea MF3/22]
VRIAHKDLGHKGIFAVRACLLDQFWWPSLTEDIKYFIRTCHACQTWQMQQVLIPPSILEIVLLFQKIHIDTKLVTDNRTPYVAVLDYLQEQYYINHIRISTYNSCTNRIIEQKHLDVQEAIVKTVGDNIGHWYKYMHSVFWAEWITIQKATGYSPYYLVHGVEPILLFDLNKAMYLVPPEGSLLTTEELVVIQAQQLQKRPDNLTQMMECVWNTCERYAKHFAEVNCNRIKDYNFAPGTLVLIHNSKVSNDLGRKMKL